RSQRAASAAVPPLTLIALSFFLPFLRVCDHMETPLHYVRSGTALGGMWVAPRFVVAGLLAVLIGLALWRGRTPGRAAARLAALGVALVGVSMVLEWRLIGEAIAHGDTPWPWVAW